MLADYLTKGTRITGLTGHLDGGGIVGGDNGQVNQRTLTGSYTAGRGAVTFYAGDQGEHAINILPYVAGAINFTQMQGKETVSGEFTGCAMAIYNFGGTTRVCHVDTAKTSTGDAPSKATWANIKQQAGFELADEVSTMGMLGDFLDTHEPDARYANLRILGVAAPVAGISMFYVLKDSDDYVVL